MTSRISVAAAGDAMITRPWSAFDGDGRDALVSELRAADVTVSNLEMIFHDFEGYPAVTGPGMKMRASPAIAEELTWAGFDLLALANNHVMDYSYDGMETTMRTLDDVGLPYAGIGKNLAASRAPAYVQTPAGRVALVTACSTIVSGSQAGHQRPDVGGRPGIAPLRLDTRYVVSEERFEQLRKLTEELGMAEIKREYDGLGGVNQFKGTIDDEDMLRFLSMGIGAQSHPTFVIGDEPGIYQYPVQADIDAYMEQLSIATRTADWVVASLHAHEGRNGRLNDQTVPPFLESFAKQCADAGADVFVGHGPHCLRGMEIYGGVPLFYSLGNLFMEVETIGRFPAEIYEWYDLDDDASAIDVAERWGYGEDGERIGFLANPEFWESVVPVCEFGAGGVESINLLPVDMGVDRDRATRGTPVLATDIDAERIIGEFGGLSSPFGTEVEFENDTGHVAI